MRRSISQRFAFTGLTSSVVLVFLIGSGVLYSHFSAAGFPWKISESLWSESELALITSLSIDQLADKPQSLGNRYLHNVAAGKLGKKLFFDTSLSRNGTVSCALCHQPARAFTDGMKVASGADRGKRNTPSLMGVSYQQWLLWDGGKDSVWSQALLPFEQPHEYNMSRVEVVRALLSRPEYLSDYQTIFGDPPAAKAINNWPEEASPLGDLNSLRAWKSMDRQDREQVNRVFANIGKAIAAYEATLAFTRSRFDDYATEITTNGRSAVFSAQEEEGLKLFIGRGQCISCHHSPLFSNQHFHNIGTRLDKNDAGRSLVAEKQSWEIFNCRGRFSDAPPDSCRDLDFMNRDRFEMSGAFKVPTLRGVVNTAPYMHAGHFADLSAVVNHYVNPPGKRRSGHVLPEIALDTAQQAALISFLKTL